MNHIYSLLAFCTILFVSKAGFAQDIKDLPCDSTSLDSLNNKLETLFAAGSYQEALNLSHELLKTTESCFGMSSKEHVESLHNTGYVLLTMKKYQESSDYYQKSVSLARRIYEPHDPVYINILKFYAQALRRSGQYQAALPVHQEIYDYTLKYDGDDPKLLATWSNSLGLVYRNLAQLSEAKQYYEQALEITEKALGKNSTTYAIYQNNLAGLQRTMGNYEQALKNYSEALYNAEANFGKENERYALRQRNLAGLLNYMGRYEKAVPLLFENQTITKNLHGEQSVEYSRLLTTLGLTYRNMGQRDLALDLLIEAMDLTELTLGKDHPEYSSAINNAALVYSNLEQYDRAEELYKEALALTEKNRGKSNLEYAIFLDNLARIHYEKAEYDKAIPLAEQALEISSELVGEEHGTYTTQLSNLAMSLLESGSLSRAEELMTKALKLEQKILGEKHPRTTTSLFNLAKMREIRGALSSVDSLYSQVVINLIDQLLNYYPTLGEWQRIDYLNALQKRIHALYEYVAGHPGNPSLYRKIQELSLNTKGLALENSLVSKIESLASENDTLRQLRENWTNTRLRLYQTYTLSKSNREELEIDVDSLNNSLAKLESQMSHLTGRRISVPYLSYESWMDHIPSQTVIIDFISYRRSKEKEHGGERFYAALVSKFGQKAPVVVDIARENDLIRILDEGSYPGPGFNRTEEAETLSNILFDPLYKYIKDAEQLFIIPTGVLHKLSFDHLPVPGSQNLLIDQYRLRYFSNPRSMVPENELEKNADYLLLGGADFDLDSAGLVQYRPEGVLSEQANDLLALATRSVYQYTTRSGRYFPYLPGTRQEVINIGSLLSNDGRKVEVVTGPQVLEEMVKDRTGVRAPGVLHVATHGYFFEESDRELEVQDVRGRLFLSDNPLFRSGLVLSGVNRVWMGGRPVPGMEDGVLTAFEIAQLDFSRTSIVVLSACETGLGSFHDAEGVLGLQRAFLSAGVDKLILSLWKVPDDQTVELMELMYGFYIQHADMADALRRAKRALKDRYDPFYWAGFVLVE